MKINKVAVEEKNVVKITIEDNGNKFEVSGSPKNVDFSVNEYNPAEVTMQFDKINIKPLARRISINQIEKELDFKIELKADITEKLIDILDDYGISIYNQYGDTKLVKDLIIEIMDIYSQLTTHEKAIMQWVIRDSGLLWS